MKLILFLIFCLILSCHGFINIQIDDKIEVKQHKGVTVQHQSAPQKAKLRIINGCQAKPLYIDYQAPQQLWTQNLKLDPQQAGDYDIPVAGIPSTRFWPKYDCDNQGENCVIGESGGPHLPCPSYGCSPPVDSKFEATFQGPGQDDWFDTSQVDGFTLPYKFYFKCNSTYDKTIDCSKLTADKCPTQNIDTIGNVNLIAMNPQSKKFSGCYSPCSILTFQNWNNPYAKYTPQQPPADEYCCAGAYSTSETCHKGPDPTMKFTEIIHQYCPGVYAWAYDDGTGLYHCPSSQTQFTLTFFCP